MEPMEPMELTQGELRRQISNGSAGTAKEKSPLRSAFDAMQYTYSAAILVLIAGFGFTLLWCTVSGYWAMGSSNMVVSTPSKET